MTKPDIRKAVLDFFSYYWATYRATDTEDKNDSEVDIAELQETNNGGDNPTTYVDLPKTKC